MIPYFSCPFSAMTGDGTDVMLTFVTLYGCAVTSQTPAAQSASRDICPPCFIRMVHRPALPDAKLCPVSLNLFFLQFSTSRDDFLGFT